MGRSHDSQAEFFQKLGDGSAKFLTQILKTPPPDATDFDRRLAPPRAQTAAECLTFLQSQEAERLNAFNLSLRPGDEAPISLFNRHPGPKGRRSASVAGLMAEDYDALMIQSLPLGGLDAQDRQLREIQADGVKIYASRLTHTSRDIYGRNGLDQTRMTWIAAIAVALSVAAAFPVFGVFPPIAVPVAVAAAAPILAGLAMSGIYALNRNARGLKLKDLYAEIALNSLGVEALTRGRQETLIALIGALFAGAGHLHEDVAEIELNSDTAKHVNLIFALHGLLCANRQCTRWHMRMLGMAHECLSLQLRDQALMKRWRFGKLANLSHRRIVSHLRWLGVAALPALLPVAGVAMRPMLPALFDISPLSAAIGCAGAAVTIGLAAIGILRLHATTDIVVDAEKLPEVCCEAAFATTPGPAQVRLEVGISQLTGRTLIRLLRESHKHH